MAAGLFFVPDRDLEGLNLDQLWGTLALHGSYLSGVAEEHGLEDLFSYVFVDPDELRSLMARSLPDFEPPPERWYPPEEGLTWIRAMRKALDTTDYTIDAETRAELLRELGELDDVLKIAAEDGAKWRLGVYY